MTPFYFNAENFQEGQGKTFLALFVYKHVYLVIVDQTVSRKFGLWGRGWTSVQRRWGRSRVVARCPILLHFRFSIHSVFSRDHTPTLFTGWEHELFSKLLVWKKECVLFFCPLSFFFFDKRVKIMSEVPSTQRLLHRYQLAFFLTTGCLWAPSNLNFSSLLHIPYITMSTFTNPNRDFLMLVYGFHTYKCIY